MLSSILDLYRRLRILVKKVIGIEPIVKVQLPIQLEFYGNVSYGGWALPKGLINKSSIVLDIGLGEDISFSELLIEKHGCIVHGFDPTPKAIKYVRDRAPRNFVLYELGVASSTRKANFYLPRKCSHVSGSILRAEHLGAEQIEIQLISLSEVFRRVGSAKIAVLKIDIEGAEYELLGAEDFVKCAPNIDVICIEFHHRWKEYGKRSTEIAIKQLENAGFQCIWGNLTSNEEFTFARLKEKA